MSGGCSPKPSVVQMYALQRQQRLVGSNVHITEPIAHPGVSTGPAIHKAPHCAHYSARAYSPYTDYANFKFREPAMPISPDLLAILVCPACKAPVKPTADQSALKCQSPTCRRVYPIRDEIPVMLVEEATIAPE